MKRGYRGCLLNNRYCLSALYLVLLFVPVLAEALESDLENQLQQSLIQSRAIINRAENKLKDSASIDNEITKLKEVSESISITHALLQERFRSRQDTVNQLGGKALERQQAMEERYLKAVGEYLAIINSIQPSAISNQLKTLKTLLDTILPKTKRPIFGSLPYRNLNYPAREPDASPAIIPAYQGGNQTVFADDTRDTEEAPISKEIAEFAQSLNWKPVAIYEYVKNNIETEWYWGCMKGAEETLRQKSGNDCDQATLLAALLRASGFPTRYVRGSIEFFAGGQEIVIDKIKNLIGIDDPLRIAEFFQKAGIPYKPLIQGGKIANFQIEHIWVESRIPYGNYRGTMIDNSDPTWLGLDTSIKPRGNAYNTPLELSASSAQLSAIRDEYLSAIRTETPLEFFKAKLLALSPQLSADSYKLTRSLIPESMKILPASMQFEQKKITHEYTEIPEDLKHKVKLSAVSDQPSANNNKFFEITMPIYKLGNQHIIMTYEPETVEDQQIIDSFGGLDNTPAYLVRLRPVLNVNEERMVVGKDGLPMGTDYDLTIELISPNGIERISNTHITGNMAAIGIVAGKVTPSISPLPQGGASAAISDEDDAEALLYKAANRYIDRWNQAEDELASLLHLVITRPIPTVVTVGGVIDVTYLLDMPHGFEWKGVFMDAGCRAVSIQPSAFSIGANGGSPSANERQKIFMQLSALQGSILENRIFEDDFGVESISTAKLFQILSAQQSAISSQLLTIDRTNINAILPSLDLPDYIKDDIGNAVNQGLTVRLPFADGLLLNAVSYLDWSGIGYIKENPSTGEAGYMLSGMLVPFLELAGGMTAINKESWKKQDLANSFSNPNSKAKPNKKPDEAVRIVKLNKDGSDYKDGIVGTALKTSFEVIALDAKDIPVQGLKIAFKISAGAGKLQGVTKAGKPIAGNAAPAAEVTLTTGADGIARARLTLGLQTETSPFYMQRTNMSGEKYWELAGLNLVSVSANTTKGRMTTDKPFEAYGRPGAAAELIKLNPTSDIYGPPSVFASLLWVKIVDQYGNPISDKNVKFSLKRDFIGTSPSSGTINAKIFGDIADCPGIATIDCPKAKDADTKPFEKRTEYFGVHPYLIMGNTENTKYTITATAFKDAFDSQGRRIDNKTALNNAAFTFYANSIAGGTLENNYLSVYALYAIDGEGHRIDAGAAGKEYGQPVTAAMFYTERSADRTFKIIPVVKDPPAGSPLKNDAKVEFQVELGGGSVDPAKQMQEKDGYFSTTLKLGTTPEINRINAIGTVTASIPSYDAQGNVTRTDRALSAYYPIEIWGVKLNVPSYQQMVLNSAGYPLADVAFQYTIDPPAYQVTPAMLGVEIFEQSPTGSASQMGFVPADSNGKIILSKGMAKFDTNNTYYAQVVLNRGSKTEIRSEKVPLINAALIPDYDRNGTIDDADRERAAQGDKFYFWINDDDDEGETEGSDIPGDKMLTSFSLDHEDGKVDGVRDLIDFFPVHLDIRDLLRTYDPKKYVYTIKSADASLNFAFTDLGVLHSSYYLTGNDVNLDIPITLGNAATFPVIAIGTQLVDTLNSPTFLEKILVNRGKGIILLEGKKESIAPLELEVLDVNQKIVFSMKLNLNMSGVEKMFRHKNLTPVIYTEVAPGPGSKAGELDRLVAPNCPDIECLGADPQNIKNFVFLHGYNVNGQQARGWHSEMFKRLFWSGSKARFWGVTWYGWDTQEIPLVGSVPFTRNYHINVEHAFDTVPALRNFLRVDVPGEVTLAAHSLGNMVVSSMLTEYSVGWDNSQQIKNYFMLDAAVAAEAYGSRDDNNEAEMNKDTVTNPNMIHPDWTAYKKELWASEWHLLFKGASPIDNRELLTWRNIFAKRPANVKYYNFFSQGEEVLDEHKDELKVSDLIKQWKQAGIYTWALQEKLKGKAPVDGILGSDYGGWGFNLDDQEYYFWGIAGDPPVAAKLPIFPENAATLKPQQLRIRPFFSLGNESILFDEASGSNYAAQNKIRLLADAIPARTLAAGKQMVTELGQINKFNFDMQATYKTTKKVNGQYVVFWPRGGLFQRDNWRHGDAREVAYSYVYSLFDKFVSLGGMK